MNKEYEFKTLKDIYTQLPDAETIGVCLDELKTAMMAAKAMSNLLSASVESLDLDAKCECEWPDVSKWVDDGKGEVELRLKTDDESEPVMSVKYS